MKTGRRSGPLFLGMAFLIVAMVAHHQQSTLGDLALLVGMGLDGAADGGYLLTVELAQAGNDGSQEETMLLQTQGRSWPELKTNLTLVLEKEPSWSNAALLLFGPALHEADRSRLAAALYADPDIDSFLLLAQSREPAAAVLAAGFGSGDDTCPALGRRLQALARERGEQPPVLARYLLAAARRETAPLPALMIENGRTVIVDE